jgi:hypothetical protein
MPLSLLTLRLIIIAEYFLACLGREIFVQIVMIGLRCHWPPSKEKRPLSSYYSERAAASRRNIIIKATPRIRQYQ